MKAKTLFSTVALTTASLLSAVAAQADLHFSFEDADLSTEGWTVLQQAESTSSFGSMNHDGIYAASHKNHITPADGTKFLGYTNWDFRDGFDDGNTSDVEYHYTSVIRSTTFVYNGTGEISMDLTGGRTVDNPNNPQMLPVWVDTGASEFPLNAGQLDSQRLSGNSTAWSGWITHQGVALRDAVTGDYLAWIQKDVVNNRPADGSYDEPAADTDWVTYSFDEATLQALTAENAGRKFQLDIYDSFGKGSWSWFGVDNINVAGSSVGMLAGDADDDGVVGNADLGAVVGNYTGTRSSVPFAKDASNNLLGAGTDTHLAWAEGDFDGDGDVTNSDLGVAFGNFGTVAASASLMAAVEEVDGQADLLYDPDTGAVILDATDDPNGEFINFVIKSASGAFQNVDSLSNPFGGFLFTALDIEVSATDLSFGANGDVAMYDMGLLLDAGLTEQELAELITTATYVSAQGGGVKIFDLVVVPEPTSALGLVLTGAGLIARRRRMA